MSSEDEDDEFKGLKDFKQQMIDEGEVQEKTFQASPETQKQQKLIRTKYARGKMMYYNK